MNRHRVHPLAYGIIIASAAFFTAPLLWMVFSSVKDPVELSTNPFRLLPEKWRWGNYREAVSVMPFALYLRNSMILCVGEVVGMLLSCSLAAYAFARLKWPGRNLLFGILIATMLLPWHVTMIPRFLLIREIGLYNSLGALIVPTFLGDAFSIFLLRQFFLTIPEELSEAARLDGLSELGIWWRIIMPLSKPALVAVALFQFIATWNDFGGPLLYLSDPAKFPLAYGLEQYVSAHSQQTHLLLAAATLFTLPIVVLFLFAQRTFIRGIATTGIKG